MKKVVGLCFQASEALPFTFPNGAPAPAAESLPAEDGTKLIDLLEKLDKPSCYTWNENTGYPWGNLFMGAE
ncbi:hypothetical protein ACHAW5_000762 [Stephanodiscus triporus]|uniref:Uncharacterized protein n=1 Tax=Stephanodiscus triporus TaxID=2934178 RepID=A0ABD3QT10_9STRA